MKKTIAIILCLMMTCVCTQIAAGESLVYSVDDRNNRFTKFMAQHPEINFVQGSFDYSSTSELAWLLLSREFNCDVFSMSTQSIDVKSIMQKGYCADLSESKIISDVIGRMHPVIQNQVVQDGKIMGIPTSISFSYIQVNSKTWSDMGYTASDIPSSFQELLDFLNNWCSRAENEENENISVRSGWVPELYSESSYIQWLTGLLIDEYILQAQYAGDELDFTSSNLGSLLEQIKLIGKRIYEAEAKPSQFASSEPHPLFETLSGTVFPTNSEYIMFLPYSEQLPSLMRADMNVVSVCSYTELPTIAIGLAEQVCLSLSDYTQALLFIESSPLTNPNYKEALEMTLQNIDSLKQDLDKENLNTLEQDELNSLLERYQQMLAKIQTDDYMYLLSPTQLESYKLQADKLYFSTPSLFTTGKDHALLIDLEGRFASGIIDTEQFLQELNMLAFMMQAEQE